MAIKFKSEATKALAQGGDCPPEWAKIKKPALRKLDMLSSAKELTDLRAPPGNRLEALAGDREGQPSIRINRNWRICFKWTSEGPQEVEIVDYH